MPPLQVQLGINCPSAVRLAFVHPKGAKQSNNSLAVHIGVSDMFVAKIRAELESASSLGSCTSRTGSDGRTIDTSNIGTKPPETSDSDAQQDSQNDPEPKEPQIPLTAEFNELDSLLRSAQNLIKEISKVPEGGFLFQRCKKIQSGDKIVCRLQSLESLQTEIKSSRLYKHCPMCESKGCESCFKMGLTATPTTHPLSGDAQPQNSHHATSADLDSTLHLHVKLPEPNRAITPGELESTSRT